MFPVATVSREKSEELPAERQAADHVIVQPLDESGVDEVGVQLGNLVVHFSSGSRVAQRIEPSFLHQEVVVCAETVADAHRVKRADIIGVLL